MSDTAPLVPVELALPAENVGGPTVEKEAVRREVTAALQALLDQLGLPGRAEVSLAALDGRQPPLQLRLHGELCRYPWELLQQLYHYVHETPLAPGPDGEELAAWLDAADPGDAIAFIRLACEEIAKLQPQRLLGPEQVDALGRQLDLAHSGDGWLAPLLARVLEMRLSLADRPRLRATLQEAAGAGHPWETAAEALIASLMPATAEIRVAPALLRALTQSAGAGERNLFAPFRDAIFYELGARFPDLRFVPAPGLKARGFALAVNHLTAPPWTALPPDTAAAQMESEALRSAYGIESQPALNPSARNAWSLVPAESADRLVSAGVSILGPLAYLALCCAADLRGQAHRFLNVGNVSEEILSPLQGSFPDLVAQVDGRCGDAKVTAVLRHLLAEHVSIRNMRRILETMLDYDVIPVDASQYIVVDERIPLHAMPDDGAAPVDEALLAAAVRAGLRPQISYQVTGGADTLSVLLLEPGLEKRLREAGTHPAHAPGAATVPEQTVSALLRALKAELDSFGTDGRRPALLTSVDVRSTLRSLVATEFPRLPVLAYRELEPTLNIQPLARITLDNG